MKALLIDPVEKTVTTVEHNGDFHQIHDLIGCGTFDCPVTLENEDTLYCDDEGLYKDQKGGIIMEDWAYPILGKILVLGTDDEGNSVDVKTTAEEMTQLITWVGEARAKAWIAQVMG